MTRQTADTVVYITWGGRPRQYRWHGGDPAVDRPPTKREINQQVQWEAIVAGIKRDVDKQCDQERVLIATNPAFAADHHERYRKVADILRNAFKNPTRPEDLVVWQVRLFCGHVVNLTAHADNCDAYSLLLHQPCPTCKRNPVTILAAKPLGLESELNPVPAAKSSKKKVTERRRAYLQKEIAALELHTNRMRRELEDGEL